jgi:DNA-binding transcriptional regulator YiaG
MTKLTMRNFDIRRLTPVESFDAKRVAELRKREGIDERGFAETLGISIRLLRRWETGLSVPFGAALKALNLVRIHGIHHLD